MLSPRLCTVVLVLAAAAASPARAGEEFQLPPEVTPALRAACESDVRRLCVGESPTFAKVRACVERRFGELGTRCKLQIAAHGLTPRSAQKPAQQAAPQAAAGPRAAAQAAADVDPAAPSRTNTGN